MGWEPGCRATAAEVRQCIEGTRGKMGQVQKDSPTPSTPLNRIQFRNTAHIEASSLQAAKIAQLGCSTQAEHSILGLCVFFLMKNLIQACFSRQTEQRNCLVHLLLLCSKCQEPDHKRLLLYHLQQGPWSRYYFSFQLFTWAYTATCGNELRFSLFSCSVLIPLWQPVPKLITRIAPPAPWSNSWYHKRTQISINRHR